MDGIGVSAEFLEFDVGGEATVAAELLNEGIEAAVQIAPGSETADADIEEFALGEIPAIAAKVRLGEEFWGAVSAREGLELQVIQCISSSL